MLEALLVLALGAVLFAAYRYYRFGKDDPSYVFVLYTIAGTVCLSYGASALRDAGEQRRLITTARSTTGTVQLREVRRRSVSSGRHGRRTEYRPAVTVSYVVDEHPYVSSSTTPIETWGGWDWANEVLRQVPPGNIVPVHYDPQNPARSFLVPRYELDPYLQGLFAFGSLIALWTYAAGWQLWRLAEPKQEPDGSYALAPRATVRRRMSAMLQAGCFWQILILVVFRDLWSAVAPSTQTYIYAGIAEAAPLVALGMFTYYRSVSRHLADARVRVSRPRLVPGSELLVKVSQLSHDQVHVQEHSVALALTVKVGRDIRRHQVISVTLRQNYETRAGEILRNEASFPLPVELGTINGAIGNSWRLEVKTRVESRPDYEASFPIMLGT